jgi:chromate transporter
MTKKDKAKELFVLFLAFFKTGFFTVGGGYAMIPIIQRVIVEEKKWLNETEMIDCLAICQTLPGAIAVNAATYIGNKRNGLAGAAVATLGMLMPSILCVTAVVLLLGALGENTYISGAFIAIKASACGLIVVTVFGMAKKVLKNPFHWTVALLVFVSISIFEIMAVIPIILGGTAGIIYTAVKRKRAEAGDHQ